MKINRLLSRRLALGAACRAAARRHGVRGCALRPAGRDPGHAAPAETGTVAPALFGIGTVEARRSYLIGPTTAGRVLRVAVDVGDRVQAGQLLAEMDPVDIDERLAALDASIARAASAVAAADAQRQDALAKRELAAMNARRYVDLGEKNFISASGVEGRNCRSGLRPMPGVSAAEANLAAALQDGKRLAAERAGLRQQRANVRLLAPADAVVTSRDAEPGSTVVAGQAVVKLIDPDSLWVKVRFDQGRSAGPGHRAAGRDRAALEPGPAAGRHGRPDRGGERQRDRRAAGAGRLRACAGRGGRRRTGRSDRHAARHSQWPSWCRMRASGSKATRSGRGSPRAVRCASCRCASGKAAWTAGSRCWRA